MSTDPPILVAEDDLTMARLLRELLRPFGREVHRAPDGDAVLPMMRQHKPSLLLLDLNMPKRNGLEVLRAVRREASFTGLRILVITGQGQPETEDKVREAGGDAFITKPIDLDEVRNQVRFLLQERGAA